MGNEDRNICLYTELIQTKRHGDGGESGGIGKSNPQAERMVGIIRGMELNFEDCSVELIDRDEELPSIAEWLGGSSSIAVDTESNSLFAYFEKVCLVQLSARGRNILIDPLALESLEPLRAVFASKAIEKIFHAGEYDILCMKRDFGFEFANVFDTMIAARILGRKEIGLGVLLESEFGIRLDKKFQKANWGQRPLSGEMMCYAAGDTIYLRRLRDRLGDELRERGLTELAEEDFRHLCDTPCGSNRPAEACWWRVTKTPQALSKREAIRLQVLVAWRESISELEDRPTYRVVRNDVLTELALRCPRTMEDLRKFPGLSERVLRKHGKSLLQNLRCLLDPADLTFPATHSLPNPSVMNRRQALRDWRKKMALKYDVPSDVILPRELLERIVARAPGTAAELAALMSDYPWRKARFSEAILAELRRGVLTETVAVGNEVKV